MDFTRDPIIETIISPKDGFKLSVRNSRSVHQDEFIVNALEVVSFGSALFFRSLEKPKAFLLPISDYEVVEVKEARMVLKNVSVEKPIKIGEGKESKSGDEKESSKKDSENKKSSKKRTSRKKRSSAKTKEKESSPQQQAENQTAADQGGEKKDEANASSSAVPVTPIVFPSPPKIIGRKLPTPEVEDSSAENILSDELVSDSESSENLIEEAAHHPQDEMSIEEVKEAAEEVAQQKEASSDKKEDQEAS